MGPACPSRPYHRSYSLYRRLPTRCAFVQHEPEMENISLQCYVVEPISQAIARITSCWKIAMFPHGMSSRSLATMSKSPKIDTNVPMFTRTTPTSLSRRGESIMLLHRAFHTTCAPHRPWFLHLLSIICRGAASATSP
jgi:hypothetical protein